MADGPYVPLLAMFACAYVPANILDLTLSAVDQGKQNFLMFNIFRLGPPTVYLVVVVTLFALEIISLQALIWSTYSGTLLTMLARAYLMRDRILGGHSFQLHQIRALLVSSLKFYTHQLIGILHSNADRLVILTFLTVADLGIYVVALTFAGAGIQTIAGTTTTILLPKISAEENVEEQGRILAMSVSTSLMIIIFLSVTLAALSPVLIPILFGSDFIRGAPIAAILCLAQIPQSLNSIIAIGLRGMDDWRTGPISMVIVIVGFATSCLLLIPSLGALAWRQQCWSRLSL